MLAAAYVAITAVLVAIGALVVGPFDGSIGATDRRVARWFEAGRTPRLDDLSYWGSMLSETAVKIVLTAVAATVMIAVWRRLERRRCSSPSPSSSRRASSSR